ncbi:hypothetical protein B0I37DRAFT_189226 [Chaetomium sp. MPI-CAGE-AT-0009]|nr:hypothetical protein B0I37DRAFT_189226 [Chaetomium sp. MPI-CAGE-AT-0009]
MWKGRQMWLRFTGDPNRGWTQSRCHVPVCFPLSCPAMKGPQRIGGGSHLLRGRDADSKVPCYASECGECCNARLDVDVIASHVSPPISPHPIRPDWLRHATLNPARQIPSTNPSPIFLCVHRDRCVFLLSDQGSFQAVATQRMPSGHGSFRWVCVKRRESSKGAGTLGHDPKTARWSRRVTRQGPRRPGMKSLLERPQFVRLSMYTASREDKGERTRQQASPYPYQTNGNTHTHTHILRKATTQPPNANPTASKQPKPFRH